MSRAELRIAADALGDLNTQVVFLGGASVDLWITDPTTRAPRVTYDVDVVIEVTTLAGYADFQEQLRRRGFREDIESGIICRWQHPASGLVLDAVPVRHELAGFSGRWLADAAAAAVTTSLDDNMTIRAVPAAWLTVLKLEAFASRGNDDVLQSRDVEDIILLVDGREELAGELAALPSDARTYVTDQLRALTDHRFIDYAVEGALVAADARARASAVTLPRLYALANRTP
jgi:predicted nucleotidyltransferase